MSPAGMIIKFVAGRSAGRIEPATHDPMRAQREKLLSILRRNQDTEYGRKYGFARVGTIEDYQKQVPVVNYEDIREDMQRVVEGARNVFTAEDPVMFAQTSGTVGSPKYIPVTPTCNSRDHKDTFRTWIAHAGKDHRKMFSGKIVSLVSPAVEGHVPCGIPFGSASGQIYRSMPRVIRRGYAIPYRAFEISDYQEKYYAIMRMAVACDVSLLITANPSTVLKMCEKANEFADDIIRDIHDGTLSKSMSIEPELRAALAKGLRPSPRRAKVLEAARRARGGALKPGDYWPNLALIGCWKGGTVGHYLENFPRWFDPDSRRAVPIRDLGYLSSEARGSIPVSDKGSRGFLTVTANFFEFVDVDELESNRDNPSAWNFLTAAELVNGGGYYIFVTTTGGLYRYDINDVIRVEGKYNQTPQIVFLRKGRGMTNITGEKISVNQVIAAYEHAASVTGAAPAHFKAEADSRAARYVFCVEFNTSVTPETQQDFLQAIDKHLKHLNIEYKAKRDSMRLAPPVLHVMREGWYERGRKERVASGSRAFQAKTQLLGPAEQHGVQTTPEVIGVVEMTG